MKVHQVIVCDDWHKLKTIGVYARIKDARDIMRSIKIWEDRYRKMRKEISSKELDVWRKDNPCPSEYFESGDYISIESYELIGARWH